MGSALLLGPALVAAQMHRLDGMTPTDALVYAQETLPTAVMGARALELPGDADPQDGTGNTDIVVAPRRAIGGGDGVYLRIDLEGAQFVAAPELIIYSAVPDDGSARTVTTATTASPLSSGGANSSFAVIEIGQDVGAGGLVGARIAANTAGGELGLTVASGRVTATITAYTDPDDALDEVGARGTFAGSNTLIQLASGVNVTIKAAADPVASVATGFVRFAGGAGTARLGWLGIQESLTGADGMASGVRDATTGIQLVQGGVIAGTAGTDDQGQATFDYSGTATFSVMGNLDIGAFNIKMENDDFNPATDDNAAMCDGGVENMVDQGDLVDAENMPLIGEEGELPMGVESAMTMALAPDVYLLCVNVDVTGPMSNMAAIPKGDYSATAYLKRDAMVNTPTLTVGEGDLASIDRDGASVEIPYLTTSEKHNQRIIVVNRGSRPVPITGITFTSEDGVDVELTDTVQTALDSGLLAVPAQSSWVARSEDVITFTSEGARRTAATINFFSTKDSLSVATTQVNISDGSTDTVVYNVEGR